jgi:hypothetical protein
VFIVSSPAVVSAWLLRGVFIVLGGGIIVLVGAVLLSGRVLRYNIRHRLRLYKAFDPQFDDSAKIWREQRLVARLIIGFGALVVVSGLFVIISRGI